MAKAIIDQRRELVKDPSSREAVAEILGDLRKLPAMYRNDTLVTLALSVAEHRLRTDDGAAGHDAVVGLLWDTALHIEDGGTDDAMAAAAARRLVEHDQVDELRMVLDKPRVEVAGAKVGIVEDRSVIRDGRGGADEHELAQRATGACDGLRPVAAVDDELRQQRVVVRRHV